MAEDEPANVQRLTDFVQYTGRMVAERRREPQYDLISALVHAEEAGDRLSEQELYGADRPFSQAAGRTVGKRSWSEG